MTKFKAGASEKRITPPIGIRMAGYAARKGSAVGVHDDLYVGALVLDDGAEEVSILAVDLLGLDKAAVSLIRKSISERIGIDANNVLICASHTHSGPVTSGDKVDRDWISSLKERIVEVALQAHEGRRDARLGVGRGEVEGIGANRRDPEKGVVDKSVGVIRIDDIRGNPIAVLMNYACHATVLGHDNLLISADYPGYAKKVIRNALGEEAVVMFANGACGDINPGGYSSDISAIGGYIPGRTFERAEKLGSLLGKEVLRVAKNVKTHPRINLSMVTERVRLPLRELPTLKEAEERLEEKEELVRRLEDQGASSHEVTEAKIAAVYAKVELAHARKASLLPTNDMETELQAIALDEALLVALPGEAFVEIGLSVKNKCRFNHTLVIGYANDSIGYIPTKEALLKGGYEVTASMLSLEGVRRLKETALSLVGRMNVGRGLERQVWPGVRSEV